MDHQALAAELLRQHDAREQSRPLEGARSRLLRRLLLPPSRIFRPPLDDVRQSLELALKNGEWDVSPPTLSRTLRPASLLLLFPGH